MRKILQVGPKAGQAIAEFSREFQYEFVTLLRTRHQTTRVRANTVYNEYIQDKHHIHMNATRWVTLSGFIMTLGQAGTVKVDEDDKGLWITWIDNRPETLKKQAALQKRERATMDGEERERAMLEEQIARAKAALPEEDGPKELVKAEGEKISLNLAPVTHPDSVPPTVSSAAQASNGPTSNGDVKPTLSFGGISSQTSKPANVFKSASSNVFKKRERPDDDDTASVATSRQPEQKKYISEAERLMKEDQARRRPLGGQGYSGQGPRREDHKRKSNF